MSSPDKQVKRNQKACTTCRQVKLKCDSNERFPAPCTRCVKKNLQCRTDPDFKRTRTRNRLDEVTNQLNAIQKTLADQAQHRSASVPESTTLGRSADIEPPVVDVESNFYHNTDTDALPSSPPFLGQTPVSWSHVNDLFSHFETEYYRHCPILDTSAPIYSVYRSSPILFWSIIMISTRWHPDLHHQYSLLLEPYRSLLGEVFINQVFRLETIQALTLLCFWPLAVLRQVEDPSWNYCGFITNAAMKLGLHKYQPNDSTPTSRMKRKTWVAIVQANCTHGWTSGMTIPSDILNSIGTSQLDRCTTAEEKFFTKAEVFRKLAKHSSLIINFKPSIDSFPFLQSLCADLDNVRDGRQSSWSLDTEIVVLGAQLCVYAVQLDQVRKNRSSTTQQLPSIDEDMLSSSRDCINIAYMTAAKLVHHFSEMVGEASNPITSRDKPIVVSQRYLPKYYFALLLMCMAFIYRTKLLHSSDRKIFTSDPDTHLGQAYQILTSWSREPLDEPGRAARVLRIMLQAERQGGLKLRESIDEGRPGVAFLDEMINTAREIRERTERDPAEPSNEPKTLDNLQPEIEIDKELFENSPFEQHLDSSLGWNFPWGLDQLSTEQNSFDINGIYSGCR